MSKQELLWLCLLYFLIGGMTGASLAEWHTKEKIRSEAIRLGHAEWVADAHGQLVFRWKEVRP